MRKSCGNSDEQYRPGSRPTGSSTSTPCAAQFPILARMIHGKPLAYLDNGASAQRAAMRDRCGGRLRAPSPRQHPSRRAYLEPGSDGDVRGRARSAGQRFINARSRNEIIFVRGTTEAINLVAQSYAQARSLKTGDEVLITHLEHHANIVPWQMVCEQTGAKLVVAPDRLSRRSSFGSGGVLDECLAPRFLPARMSRMPWARVAGAALDRRGQSSRHRHLDRRRTGHLAHAGGCAGVGLRFLRLLRPQDVRPHRASACSTGASNCSIACRRGRAAAK